MQGTTPTCSIHLDRLMTAGLRQRCWIYLRLVRATKISRRILWSTVIFQLDAGAPSRLSGCLFLHACHQAGRARLGGSFSPEFFSFRFVPRTSRFTFEFDEFLNLIGGKPFLAGKFHRFQSSFGYEDIHTLFAKAHQFCCHGEGQESALAGVYFAEIANQFQQEFERANDAPCTLFYQFTKVNKYTAG